MEILPHFWISDINKNLNFLHDKNIKNIIFLSKDNIFIKKYNHEQLRIPILISKNMEENNIIIYQHLFDVSNYIYEQINNNKNILLIGNEHDTQVLDIFIMAYFIRYGKTTLEYAIYFLHSKKKNCLQPKFYYKNCLLKFYKELKK